MGIQRGSDNGPDELTHESLSSLSSIPESQDKEKGSLDLCSLSCMDDNHRRNVSTTSLTSRQQYVSDSCAICLEPYQEGDIVVWSCTESCPHVFHKTCFVDYLLSYRGSGTPCPSCRQTFIDECICNACKNLPKRNTQAAETLSQTLIANESTVEPVHTETTLNVQQNES